MGPLTPRVLKVPGGAWTSPCSYVLLPEPASLAGEPQRSSSGKPGDPPAPPQRIPEVQKGYVTSLKILESVPWASWAPLSPLWAGALPP